MAWYRQARSAAVRPPFVLVTGCRISAMYEDVAVIVAVIVAVRTTRFRI